MDEIRIDDGHTELVPAPRIDVPALPEVGALDLYAALLADAKKDATHRARVQDIADLAGFLGIANQSAACAAAVSGSAGQGNALGLAYSRHLMDRGLAAATVNRRLATFRRLLKLARRLGVIDWTADIDGLKARAYRDTRGPGRDGMKALFELARREATTPKGKRDWALLALLYAAGLRRSEAAALNIGDVDLVNHRVQVLGKGRFEREWLPMGRAASQAIADWLECRGQSLAPEAPLFVRLDRARPGDERLSDDGMHFILSELGRRAALPRPLAPHKIRHASITRLAERTNGDLPRMREFSRHAKIETVAIYVDNAREAASELSEMLGEDLGL